MKKITRLAALFFALSMTVTACGKKTDTSSKDSKSEQKKSEKQESKKPGLVEPVLEVTNEGTPIKDGTLKIAYISDSPFKGLFHQAFADSNPDMSILGATANGSFYIDGSYKLTKGGPVEPEFKPEEKKVVITINEKYTWNDGTPVTSDDFLEYYKIVAHPEYEGVRFDDDMRNLVGLEEYQAGKAKEISGFKKVSDKQFELQFKEFSPSILWGGGIPYEPVPAHVYKNIPIKEQQAHEATRVHPLSPGAYYIKEVIPGQQAVFEANPHWWKGEPKVKKIEWKVVPSAQIIAALQSGEADLTVGLNSDLYPKVKELKNIKLLIDDDLAYTYLGFKLGKWDKDQVKTDPNAKMGDKKLRQAMGYAIDNDTIGAKFYHGLRRNATQLMIPAFSEFYNPDLKGYTYNPEKAKQLLDEAGYKDVDGDGIREDKNGKPFEIKFASMSGGATAEPIAQYYIQAWKAIGLNVTYATGRLIEFNSFYEKLKADDPGIDVYQGAWGTGSNPNPTGLYGRKAAFNYTRFASTELDEIFSRINSEQAAGDNEFMKKAYLDFGNYMFEEAPVIPTLFRMGITAVNNRVKFYTIKTGTNFSYGDVELIADKPEVNK